MASLLERHLLAATARLSELNRLAQPLLRRLERYVVAHAAAYPIAFVWAVASIPLAIHLNARAIDALHEDLPAIGDLVVRRLAWPAGVVFVLPHLFGIPWAFGRDPARWRKATWIGIAAV